jgi:hypothetical protein
MEHLNLRKQIGGLPNRCIKKSENDELLNSILNKIININAMKATHIGFYNSKNQDIENKNYYNGKLDYKDENNKTASLFFKHLTYKSDSKIINCKSNDNKNYIFNFNETIKATIHLIK